ncbi:MAG: tetrathionate reductase family octaheme c-type cytochrome [Rhodospirillales bacterium]|nr:tetrathionate reductase family octaheme c-type cytochrome [Rhodospirillales bacterium]MCW8861313.1 tetrathionate reductase family octaheme c-type cytochrome [Rhodospirillales bacterium]MCW8969811.1 tetrathionate reductase family octaheme c-type cytochrome [Rhodospirillales bacterium]MCW9002009.1 tetrathionate reductase family octaheme c-type cytochrome [Rhodospirillales bacterium]
MQARWTALLPLFAMAMVLWHIPAATASTDAQVAVSKPADETPAKSGKSTADHSKFKELQGPFTFGPDVTKACLQCHTEAAKQIHTTQHWNWDVVNPDTKQRLGKRNVINNFCGSVVSNEPRCTSCHIGYGFKDGSFDFTSQENVDCLVCHDTTGEYKKFPTGAGHPLYAEAKLGGKVWKPVDLNKVAKNVGPTSRATCGACHFTGGGGNAVKHGDLDMSLLEPGKYLDVHMSPDRLDFSCSKCHNSDSHAVQGSRYMTKSTDTHGIDVPGRDDGSRASCQSCHTEHPDNDKLNDHLDKVACQTCHVPYFARGGYKTKMWWDWSTAGKLTDDGKPYKEHDKDGYDTYNGMKGDFRWAEDVVPEYKWFDGNVKYTLFGDKVEEGKVVKINDFQGDPNNPAARIWPFKVMRGKQAADLGNKTLAVVHTFGKDDTAFWTNYKWEPAVKAGMEAVGATYSGKLGFVETEMAWPITHMVAPKEDAVRCTECHAQKSRMAGIPGVYVPGRDAGGWLDRIGYVIVVLTLLGVLGHGGLRYLFHLREKRG